MKPALKTKPQQFINGREVKSIEKWAYVYFVQFVSGRPAFISFKNYNLVTQNQEHQELDLNTIKVFLEEYLPGYNIEFVNEDSIIKIGATSPQSMPKCIIFRATITDLINVATVLKSSKFYPDLVYEKFVLKFKVFAI